MRIHLGDDMKIKSIRFPSEDVTGEFERRREAVRGDFREIRYEEFRLEFSSFPRFFCGYAISVVCVTGTNSLSRLFMSRRFGENSILGLSNLTVILVVHTQVRKRKECLGVPQKLRISTKDDTLLIVTVNPSISVKLGKVFRYECLQGNYNMSSVGIQC